MCDSDGLKREVRRKVCPGRGGPDRSREMVFVFLGYFTRMQKKNLSHLRNAHFSLRVKAGSYFLEQQFYWSAAKTITVFNRFVVQPGKTKFICSVLKMFNKTCADFAPGQIMLPLNPLKLLKIMLLHTYHI